MSKKDNVEAELEKQEQAIAHLKKRFDLLDDRLDNIDSMVSAVAERVTSRPVVMNVVCPKCGGAIEIALIGNQKPTL